MVGAASAAVGDVYCRELWGQRLSRLSWIVNSGGVWGACGVAAGVATERCAVCGDCEGGLSPGGLGVGGSDQIRWVLSRASQCYQLDACAL